MSLPNNYLRMRFRTKMRLQSVHPKNSLRECGRQTRGNKSGAGFIFLKFHPAKFRSECKFHLSDGAMGKNTEVALSLRLNSKSLCYKPINHCLVIRRVGKVFGVHLLRRVDFAFTNPLLTLGKIAHSQWNGEIEGSLSLGFGQILSNNDRGTSRVGWCHGGRSTAGSCQYAMRGL